MELPAYYKLSNFYDQDWGDWSLQHLPLLRKLLHTHSPPNARILDLACGTGVLANKLSQEGYWVMGIDLSPQMINIARSRCNANTQFEVQNMIDFNTKILFDMVTCTFDAFNYLTSINDVKHLFQNVYCMLKDNGLFIFDMNTEKLFMYLHKGQIHRKINGEEFIQYRSYDPQTKSAITKFLFSDGTTEVHQQKAYSHSEIKNLLNQTGFHTLHTFGGFAEEPFTEESYRCIWVLKK